MTTSNGKDGNKRSTNVEENSRVDGKKAKKIKPDTSTPNEEKLNELLTKVKTNLRQNPTPMKKLPMAKSVEKKSKLRKFEKPSKKSFAESSTTEKPDWTKLKKEKKEILRIRKQKHPEYDITIEAKNLWEQLRKEKKDTAPIVLKLHNVLKSHLAKIVMAHDMSRIVQWVIKLGTPEIRSAIAEELQPELGKLLISKYAINCVKKMLKYGSQECRGKVVDAFMGKVVKLMSNLISSPILENAYVEWATPVQKNRMQQEFYSDLYKFSKDDKIKCLADTFRETPAMKEANLKSTKAHLLKMINKSMSQSSLLYAVLLDFLKECNKEDRDEILGRIREWLPIMPDLKDAAHVGMMCLWYATNKEKKSSMKSLKGKIVDFAKSDNLHWILLALFDSTDDTVVLSKIVLPEVMNNVKDLAEDKFGRRVVVHLIHHCDPTYFHPNEIKILKTGEVVGTAKKSPEIRQKELLNIVSKPFLQSLTECPEVWLGSSGISLVALAILRTGEGEELNKALNAVAQHVVNPSAEAKEIVHAKNSIKTKKVGKLKTAEEKIVTVPLIAHGGVHFILKQLIKNDSGFLFSRILADLLSKPILTLWLKESRGCFILVHLLETKEETVVSRIKGLLQSMSKVLNEQVSTGALILKKALKSI